MKTWFWKKEKKSVDLVKSEGVNRWHLSKRDQQIMAIQDAYQEMVGMMGNISKNLEAQAETQNALLGAVKQVPGAMAHLKDISKVSEQQVETLQVIKSQIEANVKRDDMLANTIQGFHSTVDQFGKSNQQSEQAIEALAAQAKEAEEKVQTILLHSERRLSTVLWILIILAMSVLGAGIFLGISGSQLVRVKAPDTESPAVVEPEIEAAEDAGLILYDPTDDPMGHAAPEEAASVESEETDEPVAGEDIPEAPEELKEALRSLGE